MKKMVLDKDRLVRILVAVTGGILGLALVSTVVVAASLYQEGKKPDVVIEVDTGEGEGKIQKIQSRQRITFISEVGEVTRVSELLSDIEVTLQFTDPVTGALVGEYQIVVPDVNLVDYGNPSFPASQFLKTAQKSAVASLKSQPVVLVNAVVEKMEISTGSTGSIIGVPVQINAKITLGGVSLTRARFIVEGLNYTPLDPNSATLEALLGDIETNILRIWK